MSVITNRDKTINMLSFKYCEHLKEKVYLLKIGEDDFYRALPLTSIGNLKRYVLLDKINKDHFPSKEDMMRDF